jgi:hypothetical protein
MQEKFMRNLKLRFSTPPLFHGIEEGGAISSVAQFEYSLRGELSRRKPVALATIIA